MSPKSVDVLALTIREDECLAVLRELKHLEACGGITVGTISSPNGTISVGVARSTRQGNVAAQDTLNSAMNDVSPRWLFVVGIGGGVPDHECGLGDVVVGHIISDMTVAKDEEGRKSTFAQNGTLGDRRSEHAVSRLPALQMLAPQWANGILRPTLAEPLETYGDPNWQAAVRSAVSRREGCDDRGRPRAVGGQIASSDRLVMNTELMTTWLSTNRHARVVDMESAGAAAVARDRSMPLLVVRGLSDIIGLRRAPEWTQVACESAAALFARVLLPHHVALETRHIGNPEPDETIKARLVRIRHPTQIIKLEDHPSLRAAASTIAEHVSIADGQEIVHRASRLMRDVHPDATIVSASALPERSRLQFWTDALRECGRHSAGMVASLLLSVDPRPLGSVYQQVVANFSAEWEESE